MMGKLLKSAVTAGAIVSLAALATPAAHASSVTYNVTQSAADSTLSNLATRPFAAGIRLFNGANDTTGIPSNRFFDFAEPGTFTINSDGTALFEGTLVNHDDAGFAFDLSIELEIMPGAGIDDAFLSNLRSGVAPSIIDPSTWDFFSITSGSLQGAAASAVEGLVFDLTGRRGVQIGEGASLKNTNLGLGAWFGLSVVGNTNICTSAFCSEFAGRQILGDFHADLSPVPVPGALYLFGASLAGLGVTRRKAKKASA